jgi:lipid-A-disaccharide synthase
VLIPSVLNCNFAGCSIFVSTFSRMRYFIVAGEPSGDLHSAKLMSAIKLLDPSAEFFGIGGSKMEEVGLQSIVPMQQMSVVGFWEVAKRYSFFKGVLNDCAQLMKKVQADVFLPVDYPGFNQRLAGSAKKNQIPVVWYIAPQLWAWGKNRADNLSKIVSELFVVFPFEQEYFSQFGINTTFVGHPLMDDDDFKGDIPTLAQREKIIALLPGSRMQELERHLPLFHSVVEILSSEFPHHKFVVAKAQSIPKEYFADIQRRFPLFTFNDTINTRELMKRACAGVVKTGTSTLESSLCGMPFVMAYKASGISYMIGKRLISLPYVSLPNIIAKQHIIPELIQEQATPRAIADKLAELIDTTSAEAIAQTTLFQEIRAELGASGASSLAAKRIVEWAERQHQSKATRL